MSDDMHRGDLVVISLLLMILVWGGLWIVDVVWGVIIFPREGINSAIYVSTAAALLIPSTLFRIIPRRIAVAVGLIMLFGVLLKTVLVPILRAMG